MMLLFIRSVMLGAMISHAIFITLVPMPSRPVDFPGSSLRMKVTTCDVVISGIWKNVSCGTLSLTKFINLVWSSAFAVLLKESSR